MTRAVAHHSPVDNRGWVAVGLMVGPAVSLGLARFAYALVLPTMRSDLRWSFGTAGALNSANALGYLFGALIASRISAAVGERRAFSGSLALTAATLLASASSGRVVALVVLRLIAGAAGAVALVAGGGMVAKLGRDRSVRRATALLSIYFLGSGVGVLISGLVVPAVVPLGWRAAWLVLGGLSSLGLAAAVPASRAVAGNDPEREKTREQRVPMGKLGALTTAYGLFGAGYIAYMTFIVAYLKQHGFSGGGITFFWSLLGLSAIAGGFAWRPVLTSLPGGRSAAPVLVVVTVGAALPVVTDGPVGFLLSACSFGVGFLSVITAVTTGARNMLPEHQWTRAIGILTTVFALGQCLGPVLSGALSDGPGGIRAGLSIGAALLGLAVVAALFQSSSARSYHIRP